MVMDWVDHWYRHRDRRIGLDALDNRGKELSMAENPTEDDFTKPQPSISTAQLKPLRAFYARRKIRIPKNIPLRVLSHGRRIILGLEKGKTYFEYKGKRLAPDRDVISIPVGRRWRLLVERRDGKIVPVRLLSHEAYNHKSNWEKRWQS
jgi:hypothetical protein